MTLRMRIAAHFILFTVIVSALLWLMEVVLFERLYYDAKTRETKAIAADLAVSCADRHGDPRGRLPDPCG